MPYYLKNNEIIICLNVVFLEHNLLWSLEDKVEGWGRLSIAVLGRMSLPTVVARGNALSPPHNVERQWSVLPGSGGDMGRDITSLLCF